MQISDIIGVSIPVIAIVMGILCAIFAMYFNYQRHRQEQETIRQAVEKGVELPRDLFAGQTDRCRRSNPLRRGIFWTALGISLFIALYVNEDAETAVWGLIPFAIGIGHLIYHRMSPSNGENRPTP